MKTIQQKTERFFPKFLVLFSLLICTGVALSFSLSYSFAVQKGHRAGAFAADHVDVLAIFLKQCIILGISVIGMYSILRVNTRFLRKISFLLCCVGVIFMIITAKWGVTINGARRWLYLGSISIQTGDFARVALLLYISHIFAVFHSRMMRGALESAEKLLSIKTKLIMRFCIVVSLYITSLYAQRDYSSFLLTGAIVLAVAMCSDLFFNIKLLTIVGIVIFFIFIILNSPNRVGRIISFFNPLVDSFDVGFQLSQSYDLIQKGGLWGKGVGSTMLDVLSLPYFYNDFVFSVIVAEFGFVGAFFVLSLFLLFFYHSYRLCKVLYVYERFYFYVVLSSTVYIITSVMGHVAVTVGLVPTAGLNMPFYSMGGSFMVTLLMMCGLILKAALITDRRRAKIYTRREKHLKKDVLGDLSSRHLVSESGGGESGRGR